MPRVEGTSVSEVEALLQDIPSIEFALFVVVIDKEEEEEEEGQAPVDSKALPRGNCSSTEKTSSQQTNME